MEMKVNLSRPDITQAEIDAVVEVLKTPNLSLGPKLDEFERAFEKYTGRKHAIAVNSGTSGLYVAIKALGLGPGDEVITTPFTFICSTTTIMMVGAKPVFVDIDPVSLNMDPDKIEEKITEKTKAILPVDVFGNPCHMDKISEIAAKHNLYVIEDSCEAIGSKLNGKMAGTFGTFGFFAFYPNKQMTTGEGGVILTDDDELAELCLSLRNQGRGKGGGWLAHARLGYNFRLSDINCALGLAQLSRIDELISKRRQIAKMYHDVLEGQDGLIVPVEPDNCIMSWFVFVVRIADENVTIEQRNSVLKCMLDRGIQVSNYFPPVYLQPFIKDEYELKEGDYPITDAVCKSTIALPFHTKLTREDVELVCSELRSCLDEL